MQAEQQRNNGDAGSEGNESNLAVWQSGVWLRVRKKLDGQQQWERGVEHWKP